MIRKVAHKEIEKEKWDSCILSAANRRLYARAYFLDQISPGWDALVYKDYEAVMPLCHRKKWGISYLYQPAFFQQGGIFSASKVNNELTRNFLSLLPDYYSFAEITLNEANEAPEMEGVTLTERTNYLLDLGKEYEFLNSRFSSSLIRNLKKASEEEMQYSKSVSWEEVIEIYKNLYSKKQPAISNSDYVHFSEICKIAHTEGNLIIRKAISRQGELLAAILLLRDGGRMYNIMSCLTGAGRKAEGNYFLYDRLIREYSGSQGLILDFEGSDIPGIADFYKRFGPAEENYPFLRYNRLPWPIRLIKG